MLRLVLMEDFAHVVARQLAFTVDGAKGILEKDKVVIPDSLGRLFRMIVIQIDVILIITSRKSRDGSNHQ